MDSSYHSTDLSRFTSFICNVAFFAAISLWALIYLGHYLYIIFRGTLVWDFEFTFSSATSSFILSLVIPLSLYISWTLFIKKVQKLSTAPSVVKAISPHLANVLSFIFLLLYSAANFLFIGNFPVLIGSLGEALAGQIIIIALLVCCMSFVRAAPAAKFFANFSLWFHVEIFMLLNLLFTSRFYFLGALFALLAVKYLKVRFSISIALHRLIRLGKLHHSLIISISLLLFASLLLIRYSLSRGFFMKAFSFDVWDLIYQRSVEALPATAHNLLIPTSCHFFHLPLSLYNGFGIFLPNSLRYFFPGATKISVLGSAPSVHQSYLENFVFQFACLPFPIMFIFLFIIFFALFRLLFGIFYFNLAASLQQPNLFASSFALFSQIVVIIRSDAYFWPLAIFGFGLVVPFFVRRASRLAVSSF